MVCIFLLVLLHGYYRKTGTLISNWACQLWSHPSPLLGIVIWVQQVISDLYWIAEVLNVNNNFPSKFLWTVANPSGHHRPEAEFLDKIQTISEEFSSLLFVDTSTALLEMSISSNSCNFLQFLLRRKEETWYKTIPPSLWFKKSTTETLSLRTLKIMLRNLNVIVQYIHESGFWPSLQGIDPANTLHLHIYKVSKGLWDGVGGFIFQWLLKWKTGVIGWWITKWSYKDHGLQ